MKIKDVEEKLQISSHALRYYEKMGLIHPTRDENGYRNYSLEDIEILKKVRFLRDLDMSIEDILKLLNHTAEFQDVLTHHLESLQLQIQTLEALQEICLDLKNKEMPLLDAMINENIHLENKKPELKNVFEKVIAYIQPIETVVIGARVDSRNLMSGYITIIPFALIMALGFAFGIPQMIGYFNQQIKDIPQMTQIPIYEANTLTFMIFTCLSMLVLILWVSFMSSRQNYIEFTDQKIYICNQKFQSRLSMFLGIIKKDSRKRNKQYCYDDLMKVDIKLKFSTTSASRAGPYRIYIPHFIFYFIDGEVFEISSGVSFGEDSKMAYRILLNKDITVDIEPLVKQFYEQNDKSGYEFFEEHYRYNTSKDSHKLGGM